MNTLKNKLKILEDQGLLFVTFANSKNGSYCLTSNTMTCGAGATIDCASYCEAPDASVKRAELTIFTDDTVETLTDRLDALEDHIEKYKKFVAHRAESPNLSEALYYSFKNDQFDRPAA